jgi:hypothetical protein
VTTENTGETPAGEGQETQGAANGTQQSQEPAGTAQERQKPAEQAKDGDDGKGRNPAAEARNYRLRLRETETERDELRTRLEDTTRAAMGELIRATTRVEPDTLWKLGVNPADLLKDGVFDAVHAKGRAQQLAREHGLALRTPLRAQGGRSDDEDEKTTWSDVFNS